METKKEQEENTVTDSDVVIPNLDQLVKEIKDLRPIEEEISVEQVKAALKKVNMSYVEFMKLVLKKLAELEANRKREFKKFVDNTLTERQQVMIYGEKK
jgi:hypothetical protein